MRRSGVAVRLAVEDKSVDEVAQDLDLALAVLNRRRTHRAPAASLVHPADLGSVRRPTRRRAEDLGRGVVTALWRVWYGRRWLRGHL